MSSQKATPPETQEGQQPKLVEIISVDVEETKSWQRVVSVSLPAEEWTRAKAKQLIEVRRKVQVPGFRKGKAPKDLIASQYEGQINVDALQWLLPRAWHEALMQLATLVPIDEPEFSDIDFSEDSDFVFKATVEIRPKVEISGYKDLKVTWYMDKMPDDGVDKTIESIRNSRAEYSEVDRGCADGDRLTADFCQVDDDGIVIVGTDVKDHVFEVGSPGILESFSTGVDGLSAGAEKKFPVSYPDDYEQETLAGETRNFQVTVKLVEEKILPEVTDEFAATLGEFSDVQTLRDQIEKNITSEIEHQNRNRLEAALVQSLLAINEFEIPPSMVSNYSEHMIAEREQGGQPLTDDERKEALEGLKPGAEMALKRWFMLDAVGHQEEITASDDDFEKHLESLAEGQETTVDEVRQNIERAKAGERVREELIHRKIFTFLEESAKIKKEDIPAQAAR
jgi:trigger factor